MSFKIPYGSSLLTGPKASILKCSRYGAGPQFFQDQPNNQPLHNIYPVYGIGGLLSVVFNPSGPTLSPYTECQVLTPQNLQVPSDGPFYYQFGGSVLGNSVVLPQWVDNAQSIWYNHGFFGSSALWWGGGASGSSENTGYMLAPGHYSWKIYSAGPLNGFSPFVVLTAFQTYGPWSEFGALCAPWISQFNGQSLNDAMGLLQSGEDPTTPMTANHVWSMIGGPPAFVPGNPGSGGELNMNSTIGGGIQSGTIFLDAWVPSIQKARLQGDSALQSAIPNAGNCYQAMFSVPGSQNIKELIGQATGPAVPTEIYHVEFKLWLSGQPEPPFNLSLNTANPGQYNVLSGFPGGSPH